MKLIFEKSFEKSLCKLQPADVDRVERAISLFQQNPFHPHLRNHRLKGKLQGLHSISAGFDLRIVYREEGDHVIVFLLRVGTHNQVY